MYPLGGRLPRLDQTRQHDLLEHAELHWHPDDRIRLRPQKRRARFQKITPRGLPRRHCTQTIDKRTISEPAGKYINNSPDNGTIESFVWGANQIKRHRRGLLRFKRVDSSRLAGHLRIYDTI